VSLKEKETASLITLINTTLLKRICCM